VKANAGLLDVTRQMMLVTFSFPAYDFGHREKYVMGHGIIAWIIIGLIAGWLTGKLMKGSGFGTIMDMVVGLVGALIGGFISSHLGFGGIGEHGLIMSIVIAVIGAVILTLLLRLITGNRSANL
jgi:uncharacterized membrane protein YeaQ/YmgE (transglycosylase-associated protein family)